MTSHHGNMALIGCFTKAISLIGGSWMRLQQVFANELFNICLCGIFMSMGVSCGKPDDVGRSVAMHNLARHSVDEQRLEAQKS